METRSFSLQGIPAVLYGEAAPRVWLFVHGQMGCKEEAAAFAQIVCPKGCQVLAADLPGHGARQTQGDELTPWAAVPEIQLLARWAGERWSWLGLRANSIGAYFSLLALEAPKKALFVSPILSMEELILAMMAQAGVTEVQLRTAGKIATDFGQTLSWDYLCYVREHPLRRWHGQTCILYGEKDAMTPISTVQAYTSRCGAALTVVPEGEHWFHTPRQLEQLVAWEKENS